MKLKIKASKKGLTRAGILLFLLLAISSLSFLALSQHPVKHYDKETKTITIQDQWGNKYVELTLLHNTEVCFQRCEAIFKIKPYVDISIPLKTEDYKFSFKNDKGFDALKKELKDYWLEIKENVTYEVTVPDYEKCTKYFFLNITNATNQTCEDLGYRTYNSTHCIYETMCVVGYHPEERWKWVWKPFDWHGFKFERGKEYEIKLVGLKNIRYDPETGYRNNVDWLPTFYGLELSEWGWWNSSWQYRRNITITEQSGNTLTDYQVPINLSVSDWSNKPNSDFSDLRFTYYNSTDDTETEIPYWIEDYVASEWVYVWVKVPEIPASGSTTVYVYYGNTTPVESESNATNTLVYYNSGDKLDFDWYPYDTDADSYWGDIDGTAPGDWSTTTTGEINNTLSVDRAHENALKNISLSGVFIQADVNEGSSVGTYEGIGLAIRVNDTDGACCVRFEPWTGKIVSFCEGAYQSGAWKVSTPTTISANTWYTIRARYDSLSGKIWIEFYNGTWYTLINEYNKTGIPGYFGLRHEFNTGDIGYFRNVIVAKYADPEPTYSIGAEEIANQAPFVDSIKIFDENYVETSTFDIGNGPVKVVMRVNVTDPDGRTNLHFNLTEWKNPEGTVKVNNVSMVNVSLLDNGYTFEYNYTIDAVTSSLGTWTVKVYTNDTSNVWAHNSTTFTVVDTVSPTYQNQGQSFSHLNPGESNTLYAQGLDKVGLAYSWLETNETGTFENKTTSYYRIFYHNLTGKTTSLSYIEYSSPDQVSSSELNDSSLSTKIELGDGSSAFTNYTFGDEGDLVCSYVEYHLESPKIHIYLWDFTSSEWVLKMEKALGGADVNDGWYCVRVLGNNLNGNEVRIKILEDDEESLIHSYAYVNEIIVLKPPSNTYVWANLTWSNSSIDRAVIAWRICYNDTSNNDACTPYQTFTVGSPKWSDNSTSIPTTYDYNTLSIFNITWDDAPGFSIDTVFIEINHTGTFENYTMTLIDPYISESENKGVYNYNLTLPAGTFCWRSYANASDGVWNKTDQWCFSIAKATPSLSLSCSDVTYPEDASCSASESNQGDADLTYNFYVEDVLKASGSSISYTEDLAAGSYSVVYNTSGGQNYTSTSASTSFTIAKGVLTGTLSISPSDTVTYPTETSISYSESNVGDADVTYNIYRDGVLVGEETITLGAGSYDYVLNSTGGANWTANASIDTLTLTVNKGTPSLNIFIDDVFDNKTITWLQTATVKGNETNIGDADVDYCIYRNDTLVGCGSPYSDSTQLGNGTYVFVYNTSGGANWTAGASDKLYLFVLKAWNQTDGIIAGEEYPYDLNVYGIPVLKKKVSITPLNSSVEVGQALYVQYKLMVNNTANETGYSDLNVNFTNVYVDFSDLINTSVWNNLTVMETTYAQLNYSEPVYFYVNVSNVTVYEANWSISSETVGDFEKYTYKANLTVIENETTKNVHIIYKISASRLEHYAEREHGLESWYVDGTSQGVYASLDTDYVTLNISTEHGQSSLDEGTHPVTFIYYYRSGGGFGGGGGGAPSPMAKEANFSLVPETYLILTPPQRTIVREMKICNKHYNPIKVELEFTGPQKDWVSLAYVKEKNLMQVFQEQKPLTYIVVDPGICKVFGLRIEVPDVSPGTYEIGIVAKDLLTGGETVGKLEIHVTQFTISSLFKTVQEKLFWEIKISPEYDRVFVCDSLCVPGKREFTIPAVGAAIFIASFVLSFKFLRKRKYFRDSKTIPALLSLLISTVILFLLP